MAMVMVSQVFMVALFCVSFFFILSFVIDEPIKLAFFFLSNHHFGYMG